MGQCSPPMLRPWQHREHSVFCQMPVLFVMSKGRNGSCLMTLTVMRCQVGADNMLLRQKGLDTIGVPDRSRGLWTARGRICEIKRSECRAFCLWLRALFNRCNMFDVPTVRLLHSVERLGSILLKCWNLLARLACCGI